MVQSEEHFVNLATEETLAIKTLQDAEAFIVRWYLWRLLPEDTLAEREDNLHRLASTLFSTNQVPLLPCGCSPAVLYTVWEGVSVIDIKLSHPPGLVH